VRDPSDPISVDEGWPPASNLSLTKWHIGKVQPYESGYTRQKNQNDEENKFLNHFYFFKF
jgi:hypothetical protein